MAARFHAREPITVILDDFYFSRIAAPLLSLLLKVSNIWTGLSNSRSTFHFDKSPINGQWCKL